MTKYLLLLLPFLISFKSNAQACDCKKELAWLKKTFEENDAGFKDVIDNKGYDTYLKHHKQYEQKVKECKYLNECTELLNKWLSFFRNEHIGVRPVNKINTNINPKKNKKKIGNKINFPLNEFERYISTNQNLEFEGVWELNPYKIGIKKERDEYIGFVIESSVENWNTGDIKFKFNLENGIFYLRDRTEEKFNNIKLSNNKYLNIGRFWLRKIDSGFIEDKNIELYIKSSEASRPFIEKIDEKTLYFRIPSFNGSQRKFIDSLVQSYSSKDGFLENFIIDLRGNGGGQDQSYASLIPIIYTNPIREIGVEFLSTKLNNQSLSEYLEDSNNLDEETRKWINDALPKLNQNLGSFLSLDNKVNEINMDSILSKPNNIAILIDKSCGSTTEQFLLAAKQSKKVKLFGTTTVGALDYSNLNFVKSPSNLFELGYCLSKSLRLPGFAIDGVGIQPDYYIDDSIEPYNWLSYVKTILNNN